MSRLAHSLAPLAALAAALSSCRQPPQPAAADTGAAPAADAASAQAAPPVDPTEALWNRTYAIALAGDLALAGTEGGVAAWDVSDRKSPRLAGHLVLPGSVSSLTVLGEGGRIVAAATGPTGVAIADVSAAGDGRIDLVSDGSWASAGGCNAAWAVREAPGGKAFVACGSSGVAEADLSDPAHPRVSRTISMAGYVRDVAVLGPGNGKPGSVLVAAAAGKAGLILAEFPADGDPRMLATLDTGGEARAIAVAGKIAWVADGAMDLLGADIADPAAPKAMGRLDIDASDMTRGIAAEGTRVYLCMGDSGLAVIDVSDPAAPRRIGGFDPDRALNRVSLSGTVAFLGNDDGGILILDMKDPASPAAIFPTK